MEEVNLDATEEVDHQHFNSISLDLQPSQQFRSSKNLSLTISIESFQTVEERVGKHVSYKITGEENSNKFEVHRRYKEFRLLHRVLMQIWPGCVLPKIPPKKAVGNLKNNFIDKRKKLLEVFLVKLTAQPYLCSCEAFSMFINSKINYSKVEKDIKIPNFYEISLMYSEIFSEYTYFHPSLQQKGELRDFLKEFQDILEVLNKVRKVARQSSLAFGRYQESISGLMNGIKTITPIFLMNKTLSVAPKENYVNPYLNIREWLRADILDVESMIEGLSKYIVLEEEIQNLEMKVEKKKKHLEGMQSGKKSLGQRILNKNQETMINEEEKSIDDLEKNKDALEKIAAITVGKLLQSDIPKFKQQKVYKICISMRNYSVTTVQEYQEIAEQILQIEEGLTGN